MDEFKWVMSYIYIHIFNLPSYTNQVLLAQLICRNVIYLVKVTHVHTAGID